MTVDDFCRCTPLEFKAVYEGWAEAEQRRERQAWERTRLQCVTMLQPYSRNKIDPQDVLRFTWESDQFGDDTEKLTAQEIRKRFEKVKREQGLE